MEAIVEEAYDESASDYGNDYVRTLPDAPALLLGPIEE